MTVQTMAIDAARLPHIAQFRRRKRTLFGSISASRCSIAACCRSVSPGVTSWSSSAVTTPTAARISSTSWRTAASTLSRCSIPAHGCVKFAQHIGGQIELLYILIHDRTHLRSSAFFVCRTISVSIGQLGP